MMSKEPTLVPKRNCDQCTACCVTLRIDSDGLRKQADVPCPNLTVNGCGIYPNWPTICRTWYCGWRYMPNLGTEWRPDRSRILIRTHGGGLILQALESPLEVLTSEMALMLVGDCIENSIPIFISVPAKVGHCHGLLQINEILAPAIQSRDLKAAQTAMTGAVTHASRADTSPIEPFKPDGNQPT